MNKCKITICVLIIAVCILCGCTGETENKQQPEIEQIKAICELSTLECRYNNVAKGVKTKGEGLAHLGEKDRKYWIEYEGVVKLGIDLSKVSMRIEGTDVIVTMPEVEIQNISIVESSYNADSVIVSEDAFFNKNKITVEEQQSVVEDAQKEMEATLMANSDLKNRAQDRAKTLIESYINNLGQATGVSYNVVWESYQ